METRLAAMAPDAACESSIVDTMERPFGWVFFYQSRRYLESGDRGHRLAGNGPLIVNKSSGELVALGTARPVEEGLAEYAASLVERGA